jgi:acetyl-CoA synthetase
MASRGVATWEDLHGWSCRNGEAFWKTALEDLGVVFRRAPKRVIEPGRSPEDPRWLPGASLNIAESCFRGSAHTPAILSGRGGSDEIRCTTLGELREFSARVTAGLRALGLVAGDAVGLYMPMTVECVAAYLGVVRAGMRVVSVADSFPAEELTRRLAIGEAKLLITVDSFRRAGKRFDLYAVVRDAAAPPAVVIPSEGRPELRGGDRTWDDLLALGADSSPTAADPYAVTNVLFSSGTTGVPKAVPWTHLTPIKAAMDGRFHHDIRAGDVVAWPTNMGWMMGPWLVYASLLNGAAMALYEGAPGGEGFTRFVGRAGVTMLGVVPSLVRAWREAGAADAADWSRIRVFSSTGEPSHREDALWLMSRVDYRAPIVEYCGGTEIGGGYITGSVLQPASPAVFTTPALGLEFVILDGEGEPVSEGETGEVYLVPPSIGLSQTLINADHHAVYYEGCPPGPEGKLLRRHGDAIQRLPGGAFRARGRVDDTMNLGGIKVSSLEIEQVAEDHDAVREAAAVAIQPGGEGPERLVLFVVAQDVADPETLKVELGRAIARRLNPLFKVHEVVLVDALPRTASQKLMRRELRARYPRMEWGGGA